MWQTLLAGCLPFTLAGLPTTLPSLASMAFTPVIPAGTAGGGLAATASTVAPDLALGPISHVLSSATAGLNVPESSIPVCAGVPPRILKKIWALEYVDMWELLPESWRVEPAAKGCCWSQRPRRGAITDFPLWTECYASLVAILAVRYPHKTPQLMAYLRTITHAARNFDGPTWATYNMAFRRQAANRKSLDWGVIDSAPYSETFTGRVKSIPHCQFCQLDTHKSEECAFAPESWRGGVHPGAATQERGSGSVDICRLFNKPSGNMCRYRFCRYAHLCAKCCRGSHLAAECGSNSRVGHRSRSPSPKGKPKA